MKKSTILLTGDDGYNSLGTRLLVHFLKKDAQLAIAGTLKQQSGVGGHKHVREGGTWGVDEVDGIPALWLDGSPVDAMEAANVYFHHPFDYVISGINWGVNIDGCLYSSGTFSAAYYARSLELAKKVIAISWDLPAKHHFARSSHNDSLEEFMEHPGKTAYTVLQKTMQANLWGADIININLPTQKTDLIAFAKPHNKISGFWPSMVLDKKTQRFAYAQGDHVPFDGLPNSETQILKKNHIAIVPCQNTMFDKQIYLKMTKKS